MVTPPVLSDPKKDLPGRKFSESLHEFVSHRFPETFDAPEKFVGIKIAKTSLLRIQGGESL
jgi:hypothetical protein